MRRHVFGMAKSSLDLAGAKSQKLELDLLRLVYAVWRAQLQGDQAHGYLLVLKPSLRQCVDRWLAKYEGAGLVTCLVANIGSAAQRGIEHEKAGNRTGMLLGALGQPVRGRSGAALGRSLGETQLSRAIMRAEPGTKRQASSAHMPLGIRWDFYGIRQVRRSRGA